MNRTKTVFAALFFIAAFSSCDRDHYCYCTDTTNRNLVSVEVLPKQKRSDAVAQCAAKQTTANLQCTLENPNKR